MDKYTVVPLKSLPFRPRGREGYWLKLLNELALTDAIKFTPMTLKDARRKQRTAITSFRQYARRVNYKIHTAIVPLADGNFNLWIWKEQDA